MIARSYTAYMPSIYDERDLRAIPMIGKFESEEQYEETVKREEAYRDNHRKTTCHYCR